MDSGLYERLSSLLSTPYTNTNGTGPPPVRTPVRPPVRPQEIRGTSFTKASTLYSSSNSNKRLFNNTTPYNQKEYLGRGAVSKPRMNVVSAVPGARRVFSNEMLVNSKPSGQTSRYRPPRQSAGRRLDTPNRRGGGIGGALNEGEDDIVNAPVQKKKMRTLYNVKRNYKDFPDEL